MYHLLLSLRSTFILSVLCVISTSACHPERTESIKLMNHGLRAFKSGLVSDAIRDLEQAARVDPTNDRAHFYQGIILNELGRGNGDPDHFESAARALKKSIEVNSQDAESHYQLGVAQVELRYFKKAIEAFKLAIGLKESHGEAQFRMGLALQQIEKYNDAQDAFHAAIRAKPQISKSYTALSQLYVRFKQPAPAAQVLKNAIENHPDVFEHYRDLGLIYEGQGQLSKAIQLYEDASKRQTKQTSIDYLLAQAYFKSKDYRSSEIFIKRYLGRSHSQEERLQVIAAQKLMLMIRKSK
jgi:tetratricopeptide (TPR) repeat protein